MTNKIEKLFTSGNYDKKNKLNRGGDRVVPASVLDTIESSGATFEILESIGVPVFKYRTQITIHGLFPDLCNNRIGGYYNIFQNKNKSIGVKYTAIDRLKKQRIFNILRGLHDWTIENNSTNFCAFYYSERFDNRAKYLELLPAFEIMAAKINKDLFFGSSGVELVRGLYGYYLRVALYIGAIAETKIDRLLVGITGANEAAGVAALGLADRAAASARADRAAARENNAAKLREKLKPYFERGRASLAAAGWVLSDRVDLVHGLVVASVSVDRDSCAVSYKFKKYTKTKAQKKFRFVSGYGQGLDVGAVSWGCERQTIGKTTKGWILPAVVSAVAAGGSVRVVDYSDRAVAVIGDTKPIKEILKGAGGRFNFRLSCGPGWIFPKSKKEHVKKLIK